MPHTNIILDEDDMSQVLSSQPPISRLPRLSLTLDGVPALPLLLSGLATVPPTASPEDLLRQASALRGVNRIHGIQTSRVFLRGQPMLSASRSLMRPSVLPTESSIRNCRQCIPLYRMPKAIHCYHKLCGQGNSDAGPYPYRVLRSIRGGMNARDPAERIKSTHPIPRGDPSPHAHRARSTDHAFSTPSGPKRHARDT